MCSAYAQKKNIYIYIYICNYFVAFLFNYQGTENYPFSFLYFESQQIASLEVYAF